MAVKFSELNYWNPAEWVSRTLFTQIVENKILTNTEYERELKKEIRKCIKTYVWLIDHANSEPYKLCLLYTSPSPRDRTRSRMPSSA